MFKYQGKIFKMGLTQSADYEGLVAAQGNEVDLKAELSTFGDRLTPDVRVSGIAE